VNFLPSRKRTTEAAELHRWHWWQSIHAWGSAKTPKENCRGTCPTTTAFWRLFQGQYPSNKQLPDPFGHIDMMATIVALQGTSCQSYGSGHARLLHALCV